MKTQLLGQKKHQGSISVISDNPVVNESKQARFSVCWSSWYAALTAGKWPLRNCLLEKKVSREVCLSKIFLNQTVTGSDDSCHMAVKSDLQLFLL